MKDCIYCKYQVDSAYKIDPQICLSCSDYNPTGRVLRKQRISQRLNDIRHKLFWASEFGTPGYVGRKALPFLEY